MAYDNCSICGRKLDDEDNNICVNCGGSVCKEDYDNISGYCTDCLNDCPYWGC